MNSLLLLAVILMSLNVNVSTCSANESELEQCKSKPEIVLLQQSIEFGLQEAQEHAILTGEELSTIEYSLEGLNSKIKTLEIFPEILCIIYREGLKSILSTLHKLTHPLETSSS